ncbi:hypothetical protein H6P81_000544 [Aristolochia fimbriata]|uniref:Uncharacterized protein n=1 Tax=Aristolochia fimbriata TaxID=158543 RepID=A0AAV7F5N2_ARIFI|nr:hypothetical protein H6P81_000544 [Aristolochia fimbriata]
MGIASDYFSSSVCGTARVLKEALVIFSRNMKLFSAIALLVFIPSALFFLVEEIVIKPQTTEFLAKFVELNSDPSKLSPLFKRAIFFLSEQLSLLALLWIFSVFSMVINICASSAIYCSNQKEHPSLGELLGNIRTPWKRAAITWVYVTLFNMGLATAFVLAEMPITQRSWAFTVLKYSLTGSYYLINLFLVVVWNMGVAVSALEDGKYGMKALSKAWGLVMNGRMFQGFLLAALLSLITLPVSAIRGWKVLGSDDQKSVLVPLILGVLSVGISVLLQLFAYAAYTVFYYECKKSDGEKMDLDEKGRYSIISLSSSSS